MFTTRTSGFGAMLAGCAVVAAVWGAASPAAATTSAPAPRPITSRCTTVPWYAVPDQALGGLTPNTHMVRHQQRVMDLVEHYHPAAPTED